MSRVLQVEPLNGCPSGIGRWLWALEEVRARTHRLVDGLDQQTLDWEGLDARWERECDWIAPLPHRTRRDVVAVR
jgi:hypothetical protein